MLMLTSALLWVVKLEVQALFLEWHIIYPLFLTVTTIYFYMTDYMEYNSNAHLSSPLRVKSAKGRGVNVVNRNMNSS